jgi:hypothetical protein
MYLINNIDYIRYFFNESKKLNFAYITGGSIKFRLDLTQPYKVNLNNNNCSHL